MTLDYRRLCLVIKLLFAGIIIDRRYWRKVFQIDALVPLSCLRCAGRKKSHHPFPTIVLVDELVRFGMEAAFNPDPISAMAALAQVYLNFSCGHFGFCVGSIERATAVGKPSCIPAQHAWRYSLNTGALFIASLPYEFQAEE